MVPHTWKQRRRGTETTITTCQDLETDVESADVEMKRSSSFNLPEINGSGSVGGSSTELDRVVLSKSDAELDTKSSCKLERRVRWHRSLSVEPGALPTYACLRGRGNLRSSTTSVVSGSVEQFLSTKSGMNALWKFLKGKAGEKNLLFWLDAERIKYYSNDIDRQRCVLLRCLHAK